MEHEAVRRRTAATIKNMGVNSYSQIVSAFRAQGDLTEEKLTILPVLQDALGISRERHTAEVKRALYDEQLSEIASSIKPSSNTNSTMNWELEANYICPPVVHQPPNNSYVQLAECVLQTTPPTTIVQHQTIGHSQITTTRLNNDLQQLVDDEIRQDGIVNAIHHPTTIVGTSKQNFANFGSTDLNGSKVIRLFRATPVTKRKTSLDTLIEVVQKELLRVNGQSNSTSPSSSPPHHSQRPVSSSSSTSKPSHRSQLTSARSMSTSTSYNPHPKSPSRGVTTHRSSATSRSMLSSVLPSSHPSSLTAQSNHSFKTARKRGNINRRIPIRRRSKSYNDNEELMDDNDNEDISPMDDEDAHIEQHAAGRIHERRQSSENIEEIVRDTVDKLVAITLLNNAPFIVNMLTAIPGSGTNSSSTESKSTPSSVVTTPISTVKTITSTSSMSTAPKTDYYRNDLALLSSTASDLRNSMQQTSPLKHQSSSLSSTQQQQIHHPQLIIQPATTTPLSTSFFTTTDPLTTASIKPTTSTLFVAPRILNFQTVVPKPTTNIQIGNTKIILVSPSNITQHLPHSTTATSIQPQQSCVVNGSPVKVVKFTTTNNSLTTTTRSPTTGQVQITRSNDFNAYNPRRSTTLPMGASQSSTLTLPRNVQIVIPSHQSSASTTPATIQLTRTRSDNPMDNNKSLSNRPLALDQIPQAAQEVTITTSPASSSISSPPLSTTSSDIQQTVNVINNNASPNGGNTQQQQYFVTSSAEGFNGGGNIVTFGNNGSTTTTTIAKPRRRSSSSAPTDKPVGKVLRPIAKVLPVYSPNNSNNASITSSTSPIATVPSPQQPVPTVTSALTSPMHDETVKSMTVSFPQQQQQQQPLQRPPSTHGPMIYRMTSVNPNVPVYRLRPTTSTTTSTTLHKSVKTDAKPISVATATSMCYEPKPTHTAQATGGSVSVLACFKTTKKRNKERAIMPRPSATDSTIDTSHLSSNTNSPVVINGHVTTSDMATSVSSIFTSTTPPRLLQQRSLPSTLSDDMLLSSLSSGQQHNDLTDLNLSSSPNSSIPIHRSSLIQLHNNPASIKTITTPLSVNASPAPLSPIHSLRSTSSIRPLMEDKCIQCIDDETYNNEDDEMATTEDDDDDAEDEEEDDEEQITDANSTEKKPESETNHPVKKRKSRIRDDISNIDESWTVAADSLLRNVLSQYGFRFLDIKCQQNLSTKFDIIQANLVSGMITSKDEFYNSVLAIKQNLLENDLSKIAGDNLEKLFNYFETEYPKIRDNDAAIVRANDRKRTRRQ